MKLLTISIAAYNVEKYLEKTLSSLLICEELRCYLEVIIVNDGSSDNTKKIAEKYVSLFPDVYKLIDKSNGGYGSTINTSILFAKGRYFKQLDGDDWFIKEHLECYLVYLKDCVADIVISPYCRCYEDGRIECVDNATFLFGEDSVPIDVLLNEGKCLSMHETTIRTEILKSNKISFTENCFYTDNEYTFSPLLVAKSVAKFHAELYCYRLGTESQSVSINGAQRHYKDTMTVALSMYSETKHIPHRLFEGLFRYKLRDITDAVYTYYLVGGNGNAKNELICFDNLLKKEYPVIYKISNKTKKIHLLRLSHFLLFKLIKKRVLANWK